jgi:hypothetical protein
MSSPTGPATNRCAADDGTIDRVSVDPEADRSGSRLDTTGSGPEALYAFTVTTGRIGRHRITVDEVQSGRLRMRPGNERPRVLIAE